MDETIDWLRNRPYYRDQIRTHRIVPRQDGDRRGLDVDHRLATVLEADGISDLYRHQADAVEVIRTGRNVVVATPTASGKSLVYSIPAIERALDRVGWTLYIGPQVALINDQEETLRSFARQLGFGHQVSVAQYTGRLSDRERRIVRDRQPTILLTTPDMLHYGILPHAHRLWEWFFDRLGLVVIDELHEYRGVFGSHVGLVLRRLRRVAERFGADPQFVCCSATIGNPIQHAATLTGKPPGSFDLIDGDASATGPTHWLFWNPPIYGVDRDSEGGRRRSTHVETMRLFVDLVIRGHQTAVFTRARQTAERFAMECADDLRERGEPGLATKVAAYQAALNRDRREAIETGLHDGSIRGVWSTSALELGVDIGGLDAVLLDGYPGTRMATWQRAGRAGRGLSSSLVVLVAGEDQLDQYFMAHPADFFDGTPEQAVANPGNDRLMPGHVMAAARENWLKPDDRSYFSDRFPAIVNRLESSGSLRRRSTANGTRWTYDGGGSPQHDMSLRSIDEREILLRDRSTGDRIGSLPFGDALRDVHPGAMYHHQGRTYEVVDLDLDHLVADLSSTWASFYTKVLHDKTIEIDRDRHETTVSGRDDVPVRFADVTVRTQITGYERRAAKSGASLGREPLDLPEQSLETRALYFTIPPDDELTIRGMSGSFEGAIHAAEHAMIAMFPLELLCDRRDIGGLSTPYHPATGRSTIFIYDGYPGGVGLARRGFDRIERHMEHTVRLLEGCGCVDGCPACVQSPHCGNANEPLDKRLAHELLARLLGNENERPEG